MFNLIVSGLDIDKMARSVAAGEISGKMIFSMISGSIFRFILILLVIEIVIETMYKNRVKNYKGEVEGEIVKVLNSDKGAMAGTFPIYQYEVDNHKYIVKPLFLIFGSKLNQKYHDSEDVSYLYYALPSDVYEKHKEFIDSKLGDAGLIIMDRKEDEEGAYYVFGGFKKKAKKSKNALPLTDDKVLRYMRIGCMKWVW